MILYGYLWDMFKIALANESNNKTNGIDMFCTNCVMNIAFYKGAPDLNYKKLYLEMLKTDDIWTQSNRLKNFVNKYYETLDRLFENGNREEFEKFVQYNI